MKHKIDQYGNLLSEFAILIAIIGVFAAAILAKYITSNINAESTPIASIAEALTAANANNYASRTIDPTSGIAVSHCTDITALIQNGLPTGYSITDALVPVGRTVSCTLNGPDNTTATFSMTGVN